jgi:sodium-dependent phosphate transporter
VLPVAVFGTSWINIYFVLTKGAKKLISQNNDWSDRKASLIALYVALGTTGLSIITAIPLIVYRANKKFDVQQATIEMQSVTVETESKCNDEIEIIKLETMEAEPTDLNNTDEKIETFKDKLARALKKNFNPVIEDKVEDDELVAAMHKSAEVFEPKAEYIFSFLQVFSAISVIFAHGAGEVGYMAGPLAAIWDFTQKGVLSKKVSPPIWVILISAFGLVFGLALYGQRLTMAMAVKLTKLSPTRGFAAELATATVIMVAAQFGLPTSSSQCIIGGLVGVGLMEGMNGVNWKFFAAQAISWVINLGLSMGLVAAIFAQGVYSPSIYQASQLNQYESSLISMSKDLIVSCNHTKSLTSSLKTIGKQANPHTDNVLSLLNQSIVYSRNQTC